MSPPKDTNTPQPMVSKTSAGDAVGRQCLGRGTEIETCSRWAHAERPGGLIELDTSPAGHWRRRWERSGHAEGNFREIPVVAESDQGIADGRVDCAIGDVGHPKGGGHGVREAHAHLDGPPVGPLHTADLRIGPESTGRSVDAVDLFVQDLNGAEKRAGVGHHDFDPASDPYGPVDMDIVRRPSATTTGVKSLPTRRERVAAIARAGMKEATVGWIRRRNSRRRGPVRGSRRRGGLRRGTSYSRWSRRGRAALC